MTSLIDSFQNSTYIDQHLQLDFGKNSLNTTSITKSSTFEPQIDITYKQTAHNIISRNSQIHTQPPQKLKPTQNQHGLNKKSRCFIKQISKVLKKNKIKNPSKPHPNHHDHSNQNYLTFDTDISSIRFKASIFSKGAETSAEIKTIITEDKSRKEQFNFSAFFQKQIRKSQDSYKKRFQERKNALPKRKNQPKTKTVFICSTNQNRKSELNSQNLSEKQNCNRFQSYNKSNQKYSESQQQTIKKIFEDNDLNSVKNQSQFQIQTVKSSRVLSMKQSRKLHLQNKNKIENAKLQRSLKRTMSNFSLRHSHGSSPTKNTPKNQIPDLIIVQEQKQEPLNYAKIVQNHHFDKLRSKVMSEMEEYKNIKEIRDSEDKEKKTLKKRRTFSAQPKLILTVEGTNLTLNKHENLQNNFKGKQFKHRRPYTALSRTGLEYDRRQSYRRRASQTQRRSTCLAGVNNSANHYRTYSKNAVRQIEELDECKSDRVVRKLRQKYDNRPQTARPNKSKVKSPTGTINKERRKSECFQKQIGRMNLGKVTKKSIQKEQMKEKLLGLLVECEQEKIGNKNLKQGLDIFEDYCDNIDEGLKTITDQIDQFIRYEG